MIRYPVPNNLNFWWAWGSALLFCLFRQIVSGLVLRTHYIPHEDLSFDIIHHIINDVQYGWFFRRVHVNTCFFFFLAIYIHIGRGIYYGRYLKAKVWYTGVVIIFLLIVISFLGYTLPWRQLSYWAAVVVCNMLTGIPYVGKNLFVWLLGGHTVNNLTLRRFYILHFVLPFVLLIFTFLHIYFLHQVGSGDPVGGDRRTSIVSFYPYYLYKDLFFLWHFIFVLYIFVFFKPYYFLEDARYVPADYYKTPDNVRPEVYLIFAYTILCACNTKVGGLVTIILSMLILLILPSICPHRVRPRFQFHWLLQWLFFAWVCNFVSLTYLGFLGVEIAPKKETYAKYCTFSHFAMFLAIKPTLVVDRYLESLIRKPGRYRVVMRNIWSNLGYCARGTVFLSLFLFFWFWGNLHKVGSSVLCLVILMEIIILIVLLIQAGQPLIGERCSYFIILVLAACDGALAIGLLISFIRVFGNDCTRALSRTMG